MRIRQAQWRPDSAWNELDFPQAQLVFVFGSRALLERTGPLLALREACPSALVIGCSTAGEILHSRVLDDTVTATAVHFEHTRLRAVTAPLTEASMSFQAGQDLAHRLAGPELRHVFVLSDGLTVNGTELVNGLVAALPPGVQATGGLAADGAGFHKTVLCFDEEARAGQAVAVGFYGPSLEVKCASLGGWDAFGPERLVTRSAGNVLFDLDGHSALELYKRYLGEHASGLPASGLLFPLSIRVADRLPVVRTILAVDERGQSLTFAGDVPQGAYARLMKANFDRLIDGAAQAAKAALTAAPPELAVLISCVGRKLVLRSRIEEEIEAAREIYGSRTAFTGFYSYGEISPFVPNARCELHNQTMTITTFRET